MITEREKQIITSYAQKYNVSCVLLFGSSLEIDKDANDIDIGIKGIDPELFFSFYGELIQNMTKPIDIVDLSQESLFTQLIERKGIKIYG